MSGGDWSDSLFKDEKGDALGDGTWGRPEEPKLAPVEWDKLPEATDPSKKKVRARLATPAPGSQKESGLLDIKALAPSLAAGMRGEGSDPPLSPRQPTPAPLEPPRAARLATAAKGSAGSGLIDVQELVRLQDEKNSEKSDKGMESIAEAAMEAMKSSASHSSSGLRAPAPTPVPLAAEGEYDADLDEALGSGRSKLMLLVGVLTAAFVGLAAYVLST